MDMLCAHNICLPPTRHYGQPLNGQPLDSADVGLHCFANTAAPITYHLQ